MGWIEQSKPGVLFVDWGELKEGHKKDENIVVKQGDYIQGIISDIGINNRGNRFFRLKTKEHDKEIYLNGSAKLCSQTGYQTDKNGDVLPLDDQFVDYQVQIGDEIRITYFGMYETKSGGKGYDLRVAVNRKERK